MNLLMQLCNLLGLNLTYRVQFGYLLVEESYVRLVVGCYDLLL